MKTRMSFRRTLLVPLVATSLFGQAQENKAEPASGPEMVVATVNGRKLTAKEFEAMMQSLPVQTRQTAEQQPQQFLEQYALFENILAEAEKNKLSEQPLYKAKLADARRQILVQAQLNEKTNQTTILPEAQKAFYEANREKFQQVKAKVLFVSRASTTTGLTDGQIRSATGEKEATAKAESLAKQLREGADFVALAKEHSDDASTSATGADFPTPIRANSENVPPDIRSALLAAKPGDIVGPLSHDTGFYLFRVESKGIGTFDEVKDEVYRHLKDQAVRAWLDETRKRSTVTIENQKYFGTAKAAQ